MQRSEADRYAAAAAYPLPPVAAGAAQFESAERLQAAVLRRRAVAVPVPVHFSAEAVPAHFFAEAAALVPCSAQPKAQRSAGPEALAEQAVAPLPEESAARDAAAEPPRVAGHAEVAPEAAQGAAEELRPEAAAWVAAAVPRLEAAAARGAAEVLQPAGAAARGGRRWRRGSGSRRRGMRRRCCGRRRRGGGCGRRRALRRCFRFSVGTDFTAGLRHHLRRGLRVRWQACELRRRKS